MLDHVAVAQAGADGHSVLDMGFEAVIVVKHCGDAALGVECRPLFEARLAQHADPGEARRPQGKGKPGSAAADDEDVEFSRSGTAHAADWWIGGLVDSFVAAPREYNCSVH